MMTTYTNIDERYGDAVIVTIEDYRELNPDGNFTQDFDGIYEDGVKIAVANHDTDSNVEISETQIQFNLAKPVIDKFINYKRGEENSGGVRHYYSNPNHPELWFRNNINSLENLTDNAIDKMLWWVTPDKDIFGNRTFSNAGAKYFLELAETVTLWSALTIIKAERHAEASKPKDHVVRNLQRIARERADLDYYRSLFDVYSESEAPVPDELTEDDIFALNLAELWRGDLNRGNLPYQTQYDSDEDEKIVKRGIRLMKRYKIVRGSRRAVGLTLDVPEDAIIWTTVDAGYTAMNLHRQVIGIAERKQHLATVIG